MENQNLLKRDILKIDRVYYFILILYSALLIYLSIKVNIWEDESYSLQTSSNKLADVIKLSYNFEGQPPAYFILLTIWRYFNSGIFFSRLLSMIFVALSGIYIYRIGKLISIGHSSKWVVILFLFNPFTIWSALEIRLYSMVVFLSSIMIYNFFLFFLEKKKRNLYYFLFISLIGMYTQYFFIFEIAALGIALLVYRGWKVFFNFCLYLIPLALLFIPNLFFISSQLNMAESNKVVYSFFKRILGVIQTPQNYLLSLQNVPFNFLIRSVIKFIFFAVLFFAYIKYFKNRKQNDPHFSRINLIILSLAVIIAMYLVLITGFGIIYQPRYMSITYPMFILLFFLFDGYDFKTRITLYICLLLYYLFIVFNTYKKPIKYYDFAATAAYTERIAKKNEPILFYPKSLLPPFTHYYNGNNPLIALPALHYNNKYYNEEENIDDTTELHAVLKTVPTSTKSFIIFIGKVEGFKYTLDMDKPMIKKFLNNNFKVSLDTSIVGITDEFSVTVERLELR